jgi:hypothetical protein
VWREMDLGLRKQDQLHVCSCRSLGDQVKRGFCDRYVGAHKFLRWDPKDRIFELKWKSFLDYVHSRKCKSTRPQPESTSQI